MSRAKGLLERFMHELTKEELCSVPDELQAEIQELLAQPEHIEDKFDRVKTNRVFYQEGYAQAELDLKREPFEPEERQRLSKAYSTRAEQVAFEEGIIFAEVSYGIGEDDE